LTAIDEEQCAKKSVDPLVTFVDQILSPITAIFNVPRRLLKSDSAATHIQQGSIKARLKDCIICNGSIINGTYM